MDLLQGFLVSFFFSEGFVSGPKGFADYLQEKLTAAISRMSTS